MPTLRTSCSSPLQERTIYSRIAKAKEHTLHFLITSCHQNWPASFYLIVRVISILIHGLGNPGRCSGNKDSFEPLLQSMLQLASDGSDTQSQRAAFGFLSKSVGVWGRPSSDATNGEVITGSQGVPGFERFVYDNVVPTAFAVLSQPELNIKDGQVLVVR